MSAKNKWMIKGGKGDIVKISKENKISPFISRLLLNRDIVEKNDVNMFLKGNKKDLRDPFLFKDMDKAVNIIKEAISKKEKIVIYGDYDADGVTSTSILYKTLDYLNANFDYWIPKREEEGYGLNEDRIKSLKIDGADLLLTCDNGISALSEIELAKSLGMKVVITDHHLVSLDENGDDLLPVADAIINPNRQDDLYPFKEFSGAGIAYKFSKALFSAYKKDFTIIEDSLLELAAIGTVTDIVSLRDENRIIVKEGLKVLENTNNIGLKSLIEASDLSENKINTYHLGFIIGPAINASGRISNAKKAVELMITKNENKAKNLSRELVDLNRKRQELTQAALESSLDLMSTGDYDNDNIIVLYDENAHESIVGIVAGRLKEIYNKPTIVLSKGKDSLKGSGRSIDEYNITMGLERSKELLISYGGHPMACGLSLKEENLSDFRESINRTLNKVYSRKIFIDVPLSLEKLSENIIGEISMLEPFGAGNSRPNFGEKNVLIKETKFIGKEKNHIKFRFKKNSVFVDGIYFNGSEKFLENVNEFFNENYGVYDTIEDIFVDIIYAPEINEYMGYRNVQLNIKDFRIIN